MHTPAMLALADGRLFHGRSVGIDGITCGEIVFNTSMTGYQEMLTDPSYAQQIITLTTPHVGNVGVNTEDPEAAELQAAGLVIRDLPAMANNWRSQMNLETYLARHGIVAIADVDTRELTSYIREHGAQSACIMTGHRLDSKQAIQKARAFPDLNGVDLAKMVTTSKPYMWMEGSWDPETGYRSVEATDLPYHVVAYDFGIKRNILRLLCDNGARVTVVPAMMSADEVLSLKPDGIFLSNGPGDPAACTYAIEAIKRLLKTKLPLFGICLGCQLLALASGAQTQKMKFGHHGANHPVQDLQTQKVFVTSQNHGFMISEENLPECLQVTHRSLFDHSIQGIARNDTLAFAFQGHPEASPGPHDIQLLFKQFAKWLSATSKKTEIEV